MSVIRVNKTSDYTVMSNTHFKEKRMSLKAKGLLSLMLSLPDDWDYSINGLVSLCKENESAIKSTLNELKKFGYLVVTKKMPDQTESGRIEYEYNIYEQPKQNQATEKQALENLPIETQPVENQGQLNTNTLNTKKLNTKDKKERKKENSYDEILNTVEDEELRETFAEFIKMRKLTKNPMTDRALQMLIKKVELMYPGDIELQKKVLDNAIINNWKSVYPLKPEEIPQQKKKLKYDDYEEDDWCL